MVYCSGLESQCRNPQETAENAQICDESDAYDALFAEGSAATDGTRTGTLLSQEAFFGQAAFLQACSASLSFDDKPGVVFGKRRPALLVYYIGGETGPIKIGSARDAYTRLTTLQTASPEQLFIYATEQGGVHLERMRQSQFASAHLRGEWFARTDELLRHIIRLQQAEIARLTNQEQA